jgi:S-adenosylmethionine hydrolase
MPFRFSVIAALFLLLLGCESPGADDAAPAPTILFLSDFGQKDGAVAVCKGVMIGIAPAARILDLTHDIPAYDIENAAEVIEQAVQFYPEGTVTVAVVDPGVGSERKSIAVRTRKGHLLVGPDNGIFTLLLDTEGLDRAVELRNARYFLKPATSFTFHGRDVFSPVAAHLAAGVPLDSLGPAITPVRLPYERARRVENRVEGRVRYVEQPYGNVVTDIAPALLDSAGFRVGDTLRVSIGSRTIVLPWANTFSDVATGAPLAVVHSRALLSFSLNMGDFAARHGTRRGDRVVVTRVPAQASRSVRGTANH